jgi:uncharacterized membrane protein
MIVALKAYPLGFWITLLVIIFVGCIIQHLINKKD